VPGEDKAAAETALAELKEVKDGEDLDAIRAKTEALAQASMKLGSALYQQGQDGDPGEGPTASGGEESAPGDDKVVDADFEEVDDDKKSKSA